MCCALLLIPLAGALVLITGLLVSTSMQDVLLGASNLMAAITALLEGASPAILLGMGWVSMVLLFVASVTTAWIVALFSLATADSDLSLQLRGRHKPNAFQGKVVWVTGASQGLGAALAKYLSREGAKLILSARSADKLQQTRSCCRNPADVIILPFDLLGGDDKLQEVAKAADEAFGGAGIDFLIHNAGASQHALAVDTTSEVAQQLLDINTLAPIRLTQAVLPYMIRRRKGRLVVVASMAAKVPSPGQAVYSAAKMAVWGYFTSLATELADQGVSVTIVCPGPVAAPVGEDSTRTLYGPKGLIQRHEVQDSRRMPAARAVHLIANAMAAGVSECWLARQPVLLMAYLMQYMPQLGIFILKQVGPKRARALDSGKSGYDLAGLIGSQRHGSS